METTAANWMFWNSADKLAWSLDHPFIAALPFVIIAAIYLAIKIRNR